MATMNSSSNPESLAVLTATVNQTLVETGRFFRSSGSMQSRTQLKRVIPSAHEQFQIALDNLSEQIFIAKAFLERDYEAVKAKKEAPPAPEPAVAANEPQPAEDVVMKEDSAMLEVETGERPAEKTETQMDTTRSESKTAGEKAAEGPSAAATTGQQNDSGKTENARKEDGTAPVADQQFSGTGEEPNFDSMLPNTTGAANEFDLHLDFSNDEIGNQNFLSGANFLDSGPGNTDTNDQGKDQGNSISSLLPGLESYAANATGDDFNIDLQNTGNDTFQQQNQQQSDAQKNNNQEDIMGPGESSFDDLFMETDNFGGDGDDDLLGGDGLMDIGELDDSWFS